VGWQWFHRWGSPRWFYDRSIIWTRYLGWLSFALYLVGIIWGLAFAPVELRQNDVYRVIYIHIPVSVVALGGYILMAVSGAVGLIWRIKVNFVMMKSAAIVGAVLTFLCLVTGSLWGKPTWGTYWVWDARNIFMVILFFLYLGIVFLMEVYRDEEAGDFMVAILSLVGVVLIPVIYKSVDWWFSLHQTASFKLTGKQGIGPSMAVPIFINIGATYLFYLWFVLSGTRHDILYRERKTSWVRNLIKESQ
jgi:heme exporter protein C